MATHANFSFEVKGGKKSAGLRAAGKAKALAMKKKVPRAFTLWGQNIWRKRSSCKPLSETCPGRCFLLCGLPLDLRFRILLDCPRPQGLGIFAPKTLSAELAAICGKNKMPRTEARGCLPARGM